jgi:hypothetical protein
MVSDLAEALKLSGLGGSHQSCQKEIRKLQHLNDYMLLAIQKKDEIAAVMLEENRELREEIARLKNVIKTRELKIEQLQKAIALPGEEPASEKCSRVKAPKPEFKGDSPVRRLRRGDAVMSAEVQEFLMHFKSTRAGDCRERHASGETGEVHERERAAKRAGV